MTILPNAICRFNVIPVKSPTAFFIELGEKKFTICMETQKTQIAKTILRKKNPAGRINLPDFRLHCKATSIKTVWYWHKNRNTDQWNKIESLGINPCTYDMHPCTSFLTKEARIYSGAKIDSSINGAGKTGQLHVK